MTDFAAIQAELDEFRPMIQRFLEREVAPHYDSWEEAKLMPRAFWNTMGEAGLLLVDMPAAFGGGETNVSIPLLVMEEMCRMGFHSLASGYNIQTNIVAPYLLGIGNLAQQQRWLPLMATGEVVAALAMTEPGGGSDTAAMRTRAVRDGDHYVINGSKTFITNGYHADLVVLCAKTDLHAGAKGISLFLVDTRLPGFSCGKKIAKMGQHSSDTAELFFDNLRVPADCLLGAEGKGFAYMMQELPRERLGVAAQALGHTQGALDLTTAYVQQRHAFGQPLSKLQNTRFKLAKVKVQLELARAYFEKCLVKFQTKAMTVDDAAALKYATTEIEVESINECLQHFGGYGYTDEYPISRFYRDARIQTIYAGTSEIMLEVVARGILGR